MRGENQLLSLSLAPYSEKFYVDDTVISFSLHIFDSIISSILFAGFAFYTIAILYPMSALIGGYLSVPQGRNNRRHCKESLHLCTRQSTSLDDSLPDKSRRSMAAVADFVLSPRFSLPAHLFFFLTSLFCPPPITLLPIHSSDTSRPDLWLFFFLPCVDVARACLAREPF